MDDTSLYKSFYDRELSRRNDLDNSINIPIGVITVLVGLIYYIFSNINIICSLWVYVFYISVSIPSLLILVSIYYLVKSYNNLFKGFEYHNFPTTLELRKYQLELVDYNSKVVPEDQFSFSQYIIERYVSYTDNHININDKRALDLYKSKTYLIGAMLIFLLIIIIFLTLKI
jgi:hypothetical protein